MLPYMVSIQTINFGKTNIYKNCNFEPFCLLIKSVLLREEHIKQRVKPSKSLSSNGFVVSNLK